MKILLLDSIETTCGQKLRSENFDVVEKPKCSSEELLKIISEFDAVVVRSATQITSEIISAGKNLKVIGRAGAGVDNIDADAATRKGILVMNTPGGNTISTAEHTMSLLLSLARKIPQANASLLRNEWERKKFLGTELQGKTIGVVGLGKVGREVAKRCQAFEMNVLGFDPVLSPDVAAKMNIQLVSLEELYRRSDFITLHTPLNDETKNLLSDATLKKCKQGVRIINCARGGLVNEIDLLKHLENGNVAGAALDVFENEPPKDSPLLKHPNVIATPHLGASTEEAQEKVALQIAEQIADYLHERGISGAINGDAIQLAQKEETKPFIELAEKIGKLFAQLLKGNLRSISVSTYGSQLNDSLPIFVSAVLKGTFNVLLSEPVNFINAISIAKERGIEIIEKKGMEHNAYSQLLKVEFKTDKEKRSFAGTVFGNSNLRIVEIDEFYFEVIPEGHLLFYSNIDQPGMLATASKILADAKINIGNVSLGRSGIGEKALTVMTVDSPIAEYVLRNLSNISGVADVQIVSL
ncbi:MAG: phosphoglycerate dehydrogenase [Bacteroidota bacterium]